MTQDIRLLQVQAVGSPRFLVSGPRPSRDIAAGETGGKGVVYSKSDQKVTFVLTSAMQGVIFLSDLLVT